MEVVTKNDFLEKKEGYRVQLSNFEGPLDLLLYLIKKDEVDIYDIPIADITRQYLQYVELIKELDLELAGEFILMAATLIQIKVRMLLPKPEGEEEELEEDPRAELVRQLLEYKRFKEVAEEIGEIEQRQLRKYPRSDFNWLRQYNVKEEVSSETLLKDVSLFDLLTAFKFVLDRMPKVSAHEIETVGLTVEDQIEFISNQLLEKERFSFFELTASMKYRVEIVVTFMAMLELIRMHVIRIQQATMFGDVWLIRRSLESE